MSEFEEFLQSTDNTMRLHLMASVEPPFYGKLMEAITQFVRIKTIENTVRKV